MSLREFTDQAGAVWRVWDITPETAHPATRIEDYLQGFIDGWLVFERVNGDEKRRLYPLPAFWDTASDEDLERLCRNADPVRPAVEREKALERPPERTSRTFSYPGGREWTASEVPVQYRDVGGNPLDTLTVLRFTCGSRKLDLLAYPRDWCLRSDEELAELLWRAFPRAEAGMAMMEQRRRRGE